MNSGISSKYLYHFTRYYNRIEGILLNGFKPFYCPERLDHLNFDGKYFEFAFPIVCFCDIHEDQQKKHKEEYGFYGISLEQAWGIKNGLTPIIYSNINSTSSLTIINLVNSLKNIKDTTNATQSVIQGINNNISYLLMSSKPYIGHKYSKRKGDFLKKETKFYDEREWRYLPNDGNDIMLSLKMCEFRNEIFLEENNRKVQAKNIIIFTPKDIHSVILKNVSEKHKLLNKLSSYYSSSDLRIFKNKIIIYGK